VGDHAQLNSSQRERRQRIILETTVLAADGGWDGVQMREVASRSGVALGTLYRYFPSKEYLLVSVMLEQVEGLAERLAVRPPRGEDPVARVVDVLGRADRALQREPQVTVAMIRALVTGGAQVAPAVGAVRDAMRRIVTDAIGDSPGPDRTIRIDLLTDVWLASLVSWITGIEPASGLVDRLATAADVLLG
jgi:AcrR family transcriptional regulator